MGESKVCSQIVVDQPVMVDCVIEAAVTGPVDTMQFEEDVAVVVMAGLLKGNKATDSQAQETGPETVPVIVAGMGGTVARVVASWDAPVYSMAAAARADLGGDNCHQIG